MATPQSTSGIFVWCSGGHFGRTFSGAVIACRLNRGSAAAADWGAHAPRDNELEIRERLFLAGCRDEQAGGVCSLEASRLTFAEICLMSDF
jgi:hypothetical protein